MTDPTPTPPQPSDEARELVRAHGLAEFNAAFTVQGDNGAEDALLAYIAGLEGQRDRLRDLSYELYHFNLCDHVVLMTNDMTQRGDIPLLDLDDDEA